jgi:uncharacterized protein YraI
MFVMSASLLAAFPALAQGGGIPASVYQMTNVRSAPAAQAEVIGRLPPETALVVIGRDGETNTWFFIVESDALQGWVPGFTLLLQGDPALLPILDIRTEAEPAAAVTVRALGRVNVRTGPGIDYEVVGQLDVGEVAIVNARSSVGNDWLLIENDALQGWLAYFTVDVEGDPETLPIRVPIGNGDLLAPAALVRARYNVRIHETPAGDGRLLTIVPFNAEVTPLGRSADSRWLYIRYENTAGWGAVRLFAIDADGLTRLPVYEPEGTQ